MEEGVFAFVSLINLGFFWVKNWDIVNLGTCLDGSAIEFGGVLG